MWAVATTIAVIVLLLKRFIREHGHCKRCRSDAPPPQPPTGDLGMQTDVELSSFSTPCFNPSETSSSTIHPKTSTPSENTSMSTLMIRFSEKATSVTDLTTTSTESTKPLQHNSPVAAHTRSKTRRLFKLSLINS